MNPVTVSIFNINEHKAVPKFLDMCKSKESNGKVIFGTIDASMSKYGLSWGKCLARGKQHLCQCWSL